MKKITITFLFFLVFGSTLLFGQTGLNGINYQGVARNTNGTVLANQPIKVRISVLSGSTTGSIQYQEEHVLSTNQLGLFTLQIGKGTPVTGTFSAIPWKNANQYLRVELAIGTTSYSDLGTSQLMSVPYALYAANPGPAGPQGFQGIQGAKGDKGEIGLTGSIGLTGPIGLQGLQGIQGTKGDKGEIGLTGPTGLTGAIGLQGLQGIQGAKGDKGEIGLTGPTGLTGAIGLQGLQGIQGTKGDKGEIGLTGPTGLTGAIGLQGLQGIQGAKGDQGEIGLTGPTGLTGAIGLQGLQGIQGTKGDQGEIGLTGPTGLTGAIGLQGLQGIQGDQGEIGLTGPIGLTGTIGPQGLQGIQGDQGEIGLTGPIGLTGAIGPQGLQGIQGDQGEIGLTGPIGLTGAIGPQGLQGIQGDQGEIGLTGPIGLTGAIGPQGLQGIQGDQGEIGLTGPIGLTGAIGPQGLQGIQGDQGEIGLTGPQGTPGTITATAGGDLSGTFPNPVVVKLQNQPIAATVPTLNDVLKFNGTSWSPAPAGGGSLTLPFSATENNASALFSISNQAAGISIEGMNSSTNAFISAVQGTISSITPGGFSTGVKGINQGTGGLGVGVFGSHAGSGWGVYGVTPTGLGIYGNSSSSGIGVYANSNSGRGLVATSTNGVAAEIVINNNSNHNTVLAASTLGNGNVIHVSSTGTGKGILSSTKSGFAVHGIAGELSSAGIIGDNNSEGEAVVGRNNGDIAAAVVGRNDGGGNGVRGFIAGNNTSGKAVGVLGQIGISGSTGSAGRFENLNRYNNNGNTLEVVSNGDGNLANNILGNAASFTVNNKNSVAAGVRSEVNTVFANFGAAAIFGVSSGTGGFAGLFHSSNPLGDGPALVAFSDGQGNGITANAAKSGNGLESSVDGTGIAVYGFTPAFSDGKAARFINYNIANTNATIEVVTQGTGPALFVNHDGASGNIAVYQNKGVNVARIDKTGKGFFNAGTQASGADIAESFAVIGNTTTYEPGDILVISTDQDRAVEKSTRPYSSLVAGVYATKPGVLLTEHTIDTNLEGEVPMGVVGVIPTKVCLEGGAISRGDLLVSSSIAGVAMKADPDKVKVGQVLGKALENYNADGVSKIKVLVSIK